MPLISTLTRVMVWLAVVGILLAGIGVVVAQEKSAANAGDKASEALYGERCASCHDSGIARAPMREALAHMTAEHIREALTTGTMKEQGLNAGLTATQIDALAQFLVHTAIPAASATATAKSDAPIGACPAD